jgi:hypothetical protein
MQSSAVKFYILPQFPRLLQQVFEGHSCWNEYVDPHPPGSQVDFRSQWDMHTEEPQNSGPYPHFPTLRDVSPLITCSQRLTQCLDSPDRNSLPHREDLRRINELE